MKLNEIYNQDCLEFMGKMKDELILVDIIVTSPYNIGIKYGKYYRDNLPESEYLNRIEKVAFKSIDILKDDGSFFLNIGHTSKNPLLPFEIAKRFQKVGYKVQNTIIWVKSISIDREDIGKSNRSISGDFSTGQFKPINSPRYIAYLYEYIFHFTKSGNVKLKKLDIGVPYQDKSNMKRGKSRKPDRRDRGNLWYNSYETIQEQRPHPAVFPVKLPTQCIKLHGYNSDKIVYDHFMGSGTTALACIDLEVRYLGTEINKEYIDLANTRIIESKIKNKKQHN